MIALNCNRPIYLEDYEKLGTVPGACHHCHTGLCPVGITTQDEDLIARLPADEAAERVEGFLNSMTQELQMFARACGKNAVHDLEPEDLRAMTIEASAITGIPLVGTNFSFRPESFAQAVADAMAVARPCSSRISSGRSDVADESMRFARNIGDPCCAPPISSRTHRIRELPVGVPELRPPAGGRVLLRRRGHRPAALVRG